MLKQSQNIDFEDTDTASNGARAGVDYEALFTELRERFHLDFEDYDQMMELLDLASSLVSTHGDEQAEWVQRKPAIGAQCGNCGFSWVIAFMPMSANKLTKATSRLSMCARCGENENVLFGEINVKPSAPTAQTKTPERDEFRRLAEDYRRRLEDRERFLDENLFKGI